MALDFVALQTELYARGFDYLNDGGAGVTRVKRWLNDANHKINDLEPWVYLQASTTGTSPVSITDLGRIESVVDVANGRSLFPLDRRNLTDYFADLTTTGLAEAYYVTGGTAVASYPVTSATLTVRYWKVQTDLSANGDVPLMPDRFRMAIVEYAVAQAYRDVSNSSQAEFAELSGDAIVARMREWNTLVQGRGGEQMITGSGEDW